jgi:hypothetical protein
MKLHKAILIGVLSLASHASVAGVMITITDLVTSDMDTKSAPGNFLNLNITESSILQKYFGVSTQQGISNAGFSVDVATANASSSNLVALPALVAATGALGGPAVEIDFVFDGYTGPSGLVEWTSAVNAAGITGMFYTAQTLVNGMPVLQTGNITSGATSENTVILPTTLPLTIAKQMQIGATSSGNDSSLSFDIDTVGRPVPVPVPGSLALVALGLVGVAFAGGARRRAAGR